MLGNTKLLYEFLKTISLPETRVDDASADRFPLSFTFPLLSVVRHSLAEQKSDPSVGQNSLHHTESLKIVTSGNLQYVALGKDIWLKFENVWDHSMKSPHN